MPRPGPRRPTMTIRISEHGLAKIADAREIVAEQTGHRPNRSEVVRKAVLYGLEHHPDFSAVPRASGE